MKKSLLIFAVVLLVASGYWLVAIPAAHALTLFGINVNCDPAKAPAMGGCGFYHVVFLIAELIKKVTLYAIPLAVAMIVAGGIAIMTAGGSESRLSWGKTAIKAALIGFGLLLASTLILVTLLKLLSINPAIVPNLQQALPPGTNLDSFGN